MRTAAIIASPKTNIAISPPLTLPGCIGLNPIVFPSARAVEPVVGPETLGRQPVQVLLHRGRERPRLLLVRARPVEGDRAVRVEDVHVPPVRSALRAHAVVVLGLRRHRLTPARPRPRGSAARAAPGADRGASPLRWSWRRRSPRSAPAPLRADRRTA